MIRLFLFLLLLTGSSWATSITIGELEYLSTSNGVSGYKVILNNLTGITAQPLTFANATLWVGGSQQSTGSITSPISLLFLGGPGMTLHSCPCTSLRLQLFFPGNTPFTFMLANGQEFSARTINVTLLLPTSGRILLPGAAIPITLTAVPEPGTWVLVSTGLGAFWLYSVSGRRKRTSAEPRMSQT